jgi:hypothetical protein
MQCGGIELETGGGGAGLGIAEVSNGRRRKNGMPGMRCAAVREIKNVDGAAGGALPGDPSATAERLVIGVRGDDKRVAVSGRLIRRGAQAKREAEGGRERASQAMLKRA